MNPQSPHFVRRLFHVGADLFYKYDHKIGTQLLYV